MLLTFGIFLHTTRRGKFAVWADVLEGLQLRGDEQLLDMGCGRGAVMAMAAKPVPRGHVTGLDVARQIGYSDTRALDNPAYQPANFYLEYGFSIGMAGPKQKLGILLYDGVTELGQSGLIDSYIVSARPFVMAPERRIIQSRDRFQFLPRYDFGSVPALDRVLVPAGENNFAKQQVVAAWSAIQPGRPAEDPYSNVGFGETAYDASIRDLARTHDFILAHAVDDGLRYTANPEDFSNASWPVSEALADLALSLLGAAIVFAITHVKVPVRELARNQSCNPRNATLPQTGMDILWSIPVSFVRRPPPFVGPDSTKT